MVIAEDLAAYAHTLSYDDLTDEAVSAAKDRIIDAIACAYAAQGEEPVQQLMRVARRKQGEKNAAVIGTGTTCAVEYAALATGTLIRYLDWNDTYLSREPAHPSDNLGAVLPVAAAHHCSGKELVAAMALGYEVQCRLCDATSLRSRGFDHVNYGLVSATLAAGTLMDLTQDELAQAVNIAVNHHIVLRQDRAGELTAWKGIAFANVARNAVLSCQLAAEGLTGPTPIFEGRFGFFNQVSGEFTVDIDSWGGNNGAFMVKRSSIKYYPVEYHAQAAVHLALQLKQEHDIAWEDIEKIENETYEAAVSIIGGETEKWRPKTRETADHSMPYCIARAFMDGKMTLDQFTPEAVRDPNVRGLMKKIGIEEDAAFTDRYGDAFPHRMRITTPTGTYDGEILHPKGHPKNPLTEKELRDKFLQAAPQLNEGQVDAVMETVNGVENTNAVAVLEAAAARD